MRMMACLGAVAGADGGGHPRDEATPTNRMAGRTLAQALLAALLLALPVSAGAASLSDEQRAAVERILTREVEAGNVPGISWSIGTAVETLAEGAVGRKTVSPDTPMGAATHVPLASVSKQFTATAVYLLSEGGLLSLDAPLAQILPSYRFGADVTLREVLTMTSGISADTEACEKPNDGRMDDATLLENLYGMDLVSAPGEHFSYSNCAYDLAGAVVAKVSGMPFDAFVEAKIFEPLGMTQTYRAGTRVESDFAEGYAPDGAGWKPAPPTPADEFFASGNLVSDVADLQRWDRALLNGSLLSRKSLEEMFTVPALTSGAVNIYASGWFVEPSGAIWHGGSLEGYGNVNMLVPATGHAIVVLGNTAPHGRWKPQDVAREIYNAAELGPPLPMLTPFAQTTLPDK